MSQCMRQAISTSLHALMARDNDTIMLGEALASRGGAAMITYGFLDTYGPRRVIETPISENALVGMALGSALAGLRVIAEVYSADFLFCAGSEVINDIAKWRYQHQWRSPLHLVLRMPTGSAGTWSGPEHTQAIEPLLNNVPGLRVVVPGTARDAAAALVESVECGDPVVFLEHRRLYDTAIDDDLGPLDGTTEVSAGRVVRPGTDVTVVAWGAMRRQALEAAEDLAHEGVSAEVIDPVTVKPMNVALIAESVGRTGALLVVEEAPRTGGVAAEVMARVKEVAHVAGIRTARLTMPDVHHPFDPRLEAELIPNSHGICAAVRNLLGQAPEPTIAEAPLRQAETRP